MALYTKSTETEEYDVDTVRCVRYNTECTGSWQGTQPPRTRHPDKKKVKHRRSETGLKVLCCY